jgi:hypothetical protein
VIRLSQTTLEIMTAPRGEVPEPGEWMLLGYSLLGTAGFYLRRRSSS